MGTIIHLSRVVYWFHVNYFCCMWIIYAAVFSWFMAIYQLLSTIELHVPKYSYHWIQHFKVCSFSKTVPTGVKIWVKQKEHIFKCLFISFKSISQNFHVLHWYNDLHLLLLTLPILYAFFTLLIYFSFVGCFWLIFARSVHPILLVSLDLTRL